jgi:DNA-binding IclR family transcriptional regulator
MAKKPARQLGIQSVEVAARILQAMIDAGRPVPLKELARLARMHPGKAHRYLVSLTRTELVMQDANSGHYGVGAMSISLGLAGLRSANVVKTATALMPSLRDEINETVLLALWSPAGPVVVALEESSRPVFMNIRVGSILPLLSTSTGRVFAAFMPPGDTKKLLDAERCQSQRFTSVEIIDETRERGFAAIEGTLVPGVSAVSVPIFDHKNRITAVLGALGRTEEIAMTDDTRIVDPLLRTASAISRQLGAAEAQTALTDPAETDRRRAGS